MPILKARKALKDVPIGATLQVLATDPGVRDFATFRRTTGNDLFESKAEGRQFEFLIKSRKPARPCRAGSYQGTSSPRVSAVLL